MLRWKNGRAGSNKWRRCRAKCKMKKTVPFLHKAGEYQVDRWGIVGVENMALGDKTYDFITWSNPTCCKKMKYSVNEQKNMNEERNNGI